MLSLSPPVVNVSVNVASKLEIRKIRIHLMLPGIHGPANYRLIALIRGKLASPSGDGPEC